MQRRFEAVARTLDFAELPAGRSIAEGFWKRLRLATPSSDIHGLDKYRVLDLRRRRAQIRARRALS